jgi:hypothetical protein
MSDKEIIWFIGIALGFVAGYSLGHLRGQCAGIKWSMESDASIFRAFKKAAQSGFSQKEPR